MRILIVTASLPYPPASGGAIRTLGIIHGLYKAGYEVTLLSFHNNSIAPEATPLATYCKQIETTQPPVRTKFDRLRTLFLSTQPDIARRFYDDGFAVKLRELLNLTQYDLIQFEGIETACYLPVAKQAQPSARLSFDTFNAEYALQWNMFEIDRADVRRWPMAVYSYIQAQRITRFEHAMCRIADIVFAVSREDADLLAKFRNDGQIYVVPSGISVNDYAQPRTDDRVELEHPALVFTGTMDYRPNVDAMLWFCESILPSVLAQRPDIHLYIVGNRPHLRLEPLRQQPHIHITGWVESTQPYLHAADLYVAPLRMGSGTRLKLLEALASNCAIVATATAAAGLHETVKRGMIITDSAEEMASTIIDMLDNHSQREELGKTARDLVERYYDWTVIIPALMAAYKDIGLG